MSGLRIIACLPAYNEERYIASVLVRVMRLVDEVIVCDDGSIDLTGDIAEAMGATVIRHERNMGYGAAIKTLLKAALERGADMAITLDADEQHEPSEIGRLIDALRDDGYDLVIGSRFITENGNHVPGLRKVGIGIINKLSSNGEVSDSQSGFRAYSRMALETLVLTEDGMGVSTEILMKAREAGLSVGEVPISVRYRSDSSTLNPVVHGMEVFVSTITHLSRRRPLVLFGVPGFMVVILSLMLWGFALNMYTVTGYFSTPLAVVSMTATLIGLTLVTTSIILWVMVSEVDRKKQV